MRWDLGTAVVLALLVGVVALVALVCWWVFDPAWNTCADEVAGRVVEYRCSDGPPSART